MVSGLIIALTLICLFTPSIIWLRKLTPYMHYIMAGFLIIGMTSFVADYQRVMLTSLLCCMALNLHLKGSSNKNLRLAIATSDPSIQVAHISLGNVEAPFDDVCRYLLNAEADLINFQELTPDWDQYLREYLSPQYPNIHTLPRIDQYGAGIFSRLPFESVDTFYFRDIPNLVVSIRLGETNLCHIVSMQPVPPVSQAALGIIRQHFDTVSQYIDSLKSHVIVTGDFHMTPWSSEVQSFKSLANLQDCRRDMQTRHADGSVSLPRIPVEHILFGRAFECVAFTDVSSTSVGRLGITGHYQLKTAR